MKKKMFFTIICPICGKLVRSDFNPYPYCGESITLLEKMVVLKDYK